MSSWYSKSRPESGDSAKHPRYGEVTVRGSITVDSTNDYTYCLVESDDTGELHIVDIDDLEDIGYWR